ncbi:MAG: hypothetical protein NTX22_02740 [Ignavibacteriales bacterium]|nr:hypothetical protein [Ignavibacteriales bacterium]
MKNNLPFYIILIFTSIILISCGKEEDKNLQGEDPAFSEQKDQSIQSYNIDVQKEQTQNRNPCDTIALKEYILNNYPAGSYLLEFDRTLTYNIPKSAVIYYKSDASYVFAVIAKSKSGERLIERKNIRGFESSFINLDSTKLGTAFFFLTLFTCNNDGFSKIWEREIPIHGGFNKISMKTWKAKGTPYIETNYEDGIIVGHRNYNFFMLHGIKSYPHLLETYEGLARKRTMANVNDDIYPDYYEYHFYNLADRIRSADSVAFIWKVKDSLYVNTKNPRQTRPY